MKDELKILEQLNFSKQAAFAYLTCERLFPNYVYFSHNFDFGKPTILREAIDFLYLNIFEKNPDENKINSLSKKIEENTPDPGEFETGLASSALDACAALYHSLLFLTSKDFSNISYISTSATDSVHMYIQEVDDLDFNTDKLFQEKIDNHPLMKREISIQKGIITFLSNSKKLDYGDIQTLLTLQDNNKKSNLNL